MFLQFYGLREQPFGVTPDPRFLYMGRAQEEAFSSLVYGIETGRGFMALIASPGLGKTTILLRLMEQLQKSARTAFLFQTHSSSEELLRNLLADLDIEPKGHDLGDLQRQLGDVLIAEARSGKRLVVAIDEAQNLNANILEMVRTLSNFETPQAKLLQIILVGQPQLADKLASTQLEQLRQRVSIVTHFPPLAGSDVPGYIAHRLRVAGYRGGELLTPGALRMIAAESKGIPRNINNLCFHALSLGYASNLKMIDEATIREVVADLSLEPIRNASPVAVGSEAMEDQATVDSSIPNPKPPVTPAADWGEASASSNASFLDGVSLGSGATFDDIGPGSGPTMYPYDIVGRPKAEKHGLRNAALVLGFVALVAYLWGGQAIKSHLGHFGPTAAVADVSAKPAETASPASPATGAVNLPDTKAPAVQDQANPGNQVQIQDSPDDNPAPVESEANSAAAERATSIASASSLKSPPVKGHSNYVREVSRTSSKFPDGTGRLIVESSQSGARITLNGESNRLWVTPRIFYLPSGTYVVTVSGAGYTTWSRRVYLDEGREKLVMATLENHDGGFFTVDTSPAGMQVFIDGKPFGTSRVETVLPSGWHICEVIPGPGLQPLIRKFHLGPGESITRRIRMSSPEASLSNGTQQPAPILTASPQRGTP